MSLLWALKWLGVAGMTVGAGALVALGEHIFAAFPALARHRARLDGDLAFLGRAPLGRELMCAQLACTLICGLLAHGYGSVWPLLGAALGLALPTWLLRRQRDARVAKIESQLDGWLVTLANALRASPSLGDALSSSVATTPAPLGDEIDRLLKEHRLGVPLDHALDAASSRIRSRTLTALFLTLRVARASGGGVSDCLERAASTLREMLRLDGVVRAKTAEGKAQAAVIALLPGPFFGLLQWIDPQLMQPLVVTATGHIICIVAATMWLVAVLLARHIVQVDV
jgi:tight adherence protein B